MPKTYLLTGLDIGTGKIKTLVAQKKSGEENLEVLGKAEEISAGVRKGVVIGIEKVARIIPLVFKKVEEISNKKINSVYANIGGSHISLTSSHGLVSVSRADQKISQEDIERVIQAAQTLSLPSNREILDVFPKGFIINGEKGIKEPLGMEGVRLETEVLVLCGFSPYLKNLTKAVLNSGFQIDDLVLSPLASARAVLTSREKELGVALLDIGAGTTGLAVFEEGDLIHTTILPIGSAHITNDIAIGLKTDIDTAEGIKLEFGSCLLKKTTKKTFPRRKEKIEVISEKEPLIFSKKMLVGIIEARVSEIFGEINKELKKIARKELLPGGVVLTGGGAKLPKIVDLAKKELKLPARIGTPQGFFPSQEDPALSVVCGLVLLGADLESEGPSFSFGKGIISKLKKIFKIFIP
ncbi:cell division protein FtsA [Patescibacteria group bacterium]|nr:cell division protein FtsA [Patescibacteria group bacterium]